MTPREIEHKRFILTCIRREEAKRELHPPKKERPRKRRPRKRIRWDMQT